jgi:ankyrin repeat protein
VWSILWSEWWSFQNYIRRTVFRVQYSEWTPLHVAANNGQTYTIEALIRLGADARCIIRLGACVLISAPDLINASCKSVAFISVTIIISSIQRGPSSVMIDTREFDWKYFFHTIPNNHSSQVQTILYFHSIPIDWISFHLNRNLSHQSFLQFKWQGNHFPAFQFIHSFIHSFNGL